MRFTCAMAAPLFICVSIARSSRSNSCFVNNGKATATALESRVRKRSSQMSPCFSRQTSRIQRIWERGPDLAVLGLAAVLERFARAFFAFVALPWSPLPAAWPRPCVRFEAFMLALPSRQGTADPQAGGIPAGSRTGFRASPAR